MSIDLFKFHSAPTKLVGYKTREDHIPSYLWQKQRRLHKINYREETAKGRKIRRDELLAWMPLYVKDPEVFRSALLAYTQNGGMSNGTKRDPAIEKLIVNDPKAIEIYIWRLAQNTNKPIVWPEAVNTIITSGTAQQLVSYITHTKTTLTPQLKARIMQDPAGIVYYEYLALNNGVWKEALPAIAKSPQSLIEYLNEKLEYSDPRRLPELEPYVVKLNDPQAAAGYLEATDYGNKINPEIYKIIERDQALLKKLLNNYIEFGESQETGDTDRNAFVEHAVMRLNDIPTALAYVKFLGDRVKPFEPWLLDHAVKEQNAENLVKYSLNSMISEYGRSSAWTGCIPTIVKYSSPQQLLAFADELIEYTDYNDVIVRFLIQLEKAIAPAIANAVAGGIISIANIVKYVGDREWDNIKRNEVGWPAFDSLLQKQNPKKYKEYIKNL